MLAAIESLGFVTDGRLLALNSYENRVWQVGREDQPDPLIAKFYRPGRWSDEAIAEEHGFSAELAEAGISVVAPLLIDGHSLHKHAGYRFAVFSRQGGRAPELESRATLSHLGRVLGQLHNVGAAGRFAHRPTIGIASHGRQAVAVLLDEGWVPSDLVPAFGALSEHLLGALETAWERCRQPATFRLHGDCHPGNILWREVQGQGQAHFVDLDDCLTGPAIQDLWMLLSGEDHEQAEQLGWVLEGYRLFRDFDPAELNLIEPLRTLRMLHHAAWLARRWHDPAFPPAFPYFSGHGYWASLIGQLKEQLALLQHGSPIRLP